MKIRRLVIGSRSSRLAMAQTECVRNELKKLYPSSDFEIKTIKTVGDKIPDVALNKIGDKGLFTKEIEEALLKRHVDLAVHSMKDLPTELPQGLKIAAVTSREDPRDVLVSKESFTIKTLPKNCRVGTASLRRRAQLLYARQDLNVLDLRGNLDTRIRKLEQGSYDAIVIAYAGIKRLGLTLNMSVIPIEEILPQAGQGALGIEIAEGREEIGKMVKTLDDADSHLSIDAERSVLKDLEGGCQVPIGVYAKINGSDINIKAGVFSLDGKRAVITEISGEKLEASRLGRQLAEEILKREDVCKILDEVRSIRRES